jgi:hypothetical protein
MSGIPIDSHAELSRLFLIWLNAQQLVYWGLFPGNWFPRKNPEAISDQAVLLKSALR